MALRQGDSGDRVKTLQAKLKQIGFDPGSIDGVFGSATTAAVFAFQKSEGLLADGIAGAETLGALALEVQPDDHRPDATSLFTTDLVAQMFSSATPRTNIQANLPHVLQALKDAGIPDHEMVLMALATIRAETEGFEPIDEFISHFNTPPRGAPYSLYDHRSDLGNRGPTDGSDYKGRGFIQLTGRNNYRLIGNQIGIDLESDPSKANDSAIAARILARFLKNKEKQIRGALLINDLAEARRAINGGTHGLDNFRAAYQAGQRLTGHLISTVSASAISPPPPIPARSAQESASGPVSASGSTASAVVPRSQQVGSQINACDTGLIQGLSHQVLEKLMLMKPGVLTRIDHPLIDCSGSQNNAYLQTNAYNALVRAVEQRESRLLINSCLRTPMQQYLLYEQKQRGLCGITAAAPPPNSNHNSGLAIDIEDAHGWRPFLEDHGWHWIGAFDPMHFDYQPGGVDLGELQVKAFQELWNDHHPDAQITADGLWGPATAACVDRSPAQGFGIGPSLTRGMMSPAVGRLQLLLRKVLNMNPEQLSADCQYGSATAKAVASFQASQGLPQSGQADGSTIKALEQVSGESLQLE